MDISKIDLSKPLEKDFVKKLSIDELLSFSFLVRKNIIESCSVHGGHLASNLGVVELTIALHRFFDFPNDIILFDVGHQCYTHKLLSRRPLNLLREENGISGFPKREESEYDFYSPGHSSTSISTAMGMAISRDFKNEKKEIVCFIGDSSISNGVAFEALNNLGDFNHKIIIVLNDNEMSITEPVGGMYKMLQKMRMSKSYLNSKERYRKMMSITKLGTSLFSFSSKIKTKLKRAFLKRNLFDNLNLNYIGPVDGYDFIQMEKAFSLAKKAKTSSIIHVSTIKGKGYAPAEINDNGNWHGVNKFDIETGEIITTNKENEASWSKVYARLLEIVLDETDNSIVIFPATGSGSYLNQIEQKFKNRTFDVGISEEHAAIMASGAALANLKPYVSIYSSFMQRAYDEINHDIARLNLGVVFLVDRCGLAGRDGETHHGIFDDAFLHTMPNVAICMAKDQNEAVRIMKFSETFNHPLFIRYPKSTTLYSKKESLESNSLSYGEWEYLLKRNNRKILIISFGPVINKINDLYSNNENITLINAIFQAPLNIKILSSSLDFENIIVYDPYGIKEGFGYSILNCLNELKYKGNIYLMCLNKGYPKQASIASQEKILGVSLDNLIEKVKQYEGL